jgi:hypothetical protein
MYGTSKLRWTNGFCHGAAATIANRLADWQRNGFRDNNTRGLMVLQDAQLNEAAGKFMGQVKPMQQSRAGFGDLAAQQAGRDAGWKVNFHQGIKSEQPQGYLE